MKKHSTEHKKMLWDFSILSGINWDFVNDDITYYNSSINNRKNPVTEAGYSDLSYIYDGAFPNEVIIEKNDDVLDFDEGGNIKLIKKQNKTKKDLESMKVKELREYAKDLKIESKALMCPKVPFSALKKADLIEILLICAQNKSVEKDNKMQAGLKKNTKAILLEKLRQEKSKTIKKNGCFEGGLYKMKKAEIIDSILKCQKIV